MKSICCLFALLAWSQAHAGLAARIDQAASEAEFHIHDENGKKYLYGVPIHSPCTNNGRWACARTVAVVLNKAGYTLRRLNGGSCDGYLALSVNEVERQLRAWRKITDKNEILPGDVIVWTSLFNRGGICTGGGDCHVGVYSSKGAFHNFPFGGVPGYGSVTLVGFWFKAAYRPPN